MTSTRPESAPTGVGIIGLSAAGCWASRAHLPALRALDGYELRGHSASSPESAAAAGREHGVAPAFGSARELVECDQIDLVVVAVKVPHHLDLVSLAVEAGKPVFCEWPLGNGLAESELLSDMARKRGIRTAVGLQARSAPVVRYLRDLVADGYVGEVLSSTLVQSGRSWGAEVSHASRYVLDPANGATMLTISTGHQLDAFTMVLGEFTEVDATMATRRRQVRDRTTGEALPTSAPDQIAVSGRLMDGAVAAVHVRGGTSRGVNFHWEINGTDGDLVATSSTGLVQFATVHGGRGEDRSLSELPVPVRYHRVPALSDRTDSVAYAVAHAYAQLRDDILNGTTEVPDFEHATRRHRLLDAIEQAANTGQRQQLDPSAHDDADGGPIG